MNCRTFLELSGINWISKVGTCYIFIAVDSAGESKFRVGNKGSGPFEKDASDTSQPGNETDNYVF